MEFTNDTDLSEIRSMLTEHMRENYPLSQKSFELWYSYLKLVYLDTEKAVFACDTEIKRKVALTNNHLDFIKKCVFDVIGYSPEIEIKVDPSVAPPNPYSHNLFMEQLQSRADSSTDSSDEEEPGEVDYNEDGDDVSYTPYTPMPESESGSSSCPDPSLSRKPPRAKSPRKRTTPTPITLPPIPTTPQKVRDGAIT